jgi:iron complex transport system permease protein
LVLAIVVVAAFLVGSSSVSLPDVWALLTGGELKASAYSILVNVRLPRILAALLAGSALAVSGTIIQAVLDNPLASPNVIGINAGAGLFVLVAASLLPGLLWLSPIAAFAGAMTSAAIVFAISLGTNASRLTVILAGIAITAVFGAGMNTVLILDPDAYIGSSAFLVGGLGRVLANDLLWPSCYIIVGLLLAQASAGRLNILALGDATAHSLGIRVSATRLLMLALAAMLAGAAVSFAGLIGFAGLIVPHFVRFFVGSNNRLVIPLAALVGALFVLLCDTCARVLFAPYELPVGICLAFLGGPFFIYLIIKNKKGKVGDE